MVYHSAWNLPMRLYILEFYIKAIIVMKKMEIRQAKPVRLVRLFSSCCYRRLRKDARGTKTKTR
jgi:hypothetical protein